MVKSRYTSNNIMITDMDDDCRNCFNTSMWLYKKYGGEIYILFNKNSIHCFWYNGKYCVEWNYRSDIQDKFIYGDLEKIKEY